MSTRSLTPHLLLAGLLVQGLACADDGSIGETTTETSTSGDGDGDPAGDGDGDPAGDGDGDGDPAGDGDGDPSGDGDGDPSGDGDGDPSGDGDGDPSGDGDGDPTGDGDGDPTGDGDGDTSGDGDGDTSGDGDGDTSGDGDGDELGGPCPGIEGTSLVGGPADLYGFCWYVGPVMTTCDDTCAELDGGENVALEAGDSHPDSCDGAGPGDISTWFVENGNPGNWQQTGGQTSGHGFGYGYAEIQNYYGKCTGGNAEIGTYPGDMLGGGLEDMRQLICACAFGES